LLQARSVPTPRAVAGSWKGRARPGAVEGSERAAGVDLGQLARIADQHHLGARPISMVEQHVQLAGAHHRRFVDDHDIPVTQRQLAAVPADVQKIDDTGCVWSFLDVAEEPERARPGGLIAAGDPIEPFLGRVVDVVSGPNSRYVVHLDVVGIPDQATDELRDARLLRQ
jgi:hypothetical protein